MNEMPKNTPVIQDTAVIAVMENDNDPIGEALRAQDPVPFSPMTTSERQSMATRLEASIGKLMDDAQKNYKKNCHKPGTTDIDPNYITRLSTNEFFFYTKEPLTLNEFEQLQNKIAEKAKIIPSGVQLILGSFGVKTDDGKVMNVTPHITCGSSPDFHFVLKHYTSPIDVRYKIPDGTGNSNTLPVLDSANPSFPMPQITVNGTPKKFTFNNVIPCKTPGGTSFITAIDICLDHSYGVAKTNYINLAKNKPALLKLPISHVVISNSVEVKKEKCIGTTIMHADTIHTPTACKKGVFQRARIPQKSAFGNDYYTTFDIARQQVKPLIDGIRNTYAYKAKDPSGGRDHKSYTVTLEKVQFQESEFTTEFAKFRNKYQGCKGDHLKTQILDNLKKRIEATTSLIDLDDLKKELKTSYEVDVLKTGQGWFAQKFGIKTSSEKVLEKMIAEQEKQLTTAGLKY